MNEKVIELTRILRRTGIGWLAREVEELSEVDEPDGVQTSSQAAQHVRSRLSNVIDQLDESLHNVRQLVEGSNDRIALEHPHAPEDPDTEASSDAPHTEEHDYTAEDLSDARGHLDRLVTALQDWERNDG